MKNIVRLFFFFFQAEDGIRDFHVTGVQTCALPISPTPARGGRFNLTPREQQVLALVASGMSDGEIASSLVISKKTASVHVANIKAKLGASSRVEVATIALRESLT